ncbi:hypothetical protein [Flavobacterium sp. WC2509]|uniref:hypothetical protein n=1 Tax=Flavobacterium sp. WC2509 TaxID=3461406 RepID=UPI004043B2FA
MKRYILLFLLTFQMVFSQEVVVKGKAFNSGKFNDRVVYIVKNDTINKERKHNHSLYANWKEKSKFENRKDTSYLEFNKSLEVLEQLFKTKPLCTESAEVCFTRD